MPIGFYGDNKVVYATKTKINLIKIIPIELKKKFDEPWIGSKAERVPGG